MLTTKFLKRTVVTLAPCPTTHHECATCGTTVGRSDADCPHCADSRIVTYRLS